MHDPARRALRPTARALEMVPVRRGSLSHTLRISSVSGVAMWPRLVLGADDDEALYVEARGLDGNPRRSHWQLVMPLLSAQPQRVSAGDRVRVDSTVELGARVDVPVRYQLDVNIVPGRWAAPKS